MRPTSRRAAASSFWRGYAASLRRSWLGRIRPVPVDQVHVHLAADERAQVLRDARAFEHVPTRHVPSGLVPLPNRSHPG